MGFDGSIKIEFTGANITSNGSLLAYLELDHAFGLFDLISAVFIDNALALITNMLCPLYYDNRYTAVLRVIKGL